MAGHNHSHGHDHNHSHAGHHHHHSEISNTKVLFAAFLLTFLFMFVEFIGGIISNSLALISDAGHMLSDSTSLVMAFIALYIGKKAATATKTFGYKRIETITAFVNALTLIVVSVIIFKEGITRIITPVEVKAEQMILIAFAGFVVNIIVAVILFRSSKENLNIKGAFLHVIGDLLGSAGAIIAGIIIKYTGWLYADPVISLIIAALIVVSAYALLNETFHLLMEGTPRHINIEDVEKLILEEKEVTEVHDLHIWSLTDTKIMLTGHVVINEITVAETVIRNIKNKLQQKYKIAHSTIEVETNKCNYGCD